jgi:hypothetical protein
MAWHTDPLVDKARTLYLRAALRAGIPELEIRQPIAGDSTREGDVIVLRNGPTVAARFRVRPDGSRLRRLDERRPDRVRRPARVEEPDFTDDDMAIMDRIWDNGLNKPPAAST